MSQEFVPAQSIQEVILRLDEIIETAASTQSANGIFPALYVIVTETVYAGIVNGDIFEDNPRMEKLDVIFANRFLEAVHQHQHGQPQSQAWALSFATAERFSRKLILQQLLVGMNAHINLDLGIASAEVAPGDQINGLKNDFDAINSILASLVDEVKSDLVELSPRFSLVLSWFKGREDAILNFSVQKARDAAWKFATKLAKGSDRKDQKLVARRDELSVKIGKRIIGPGLIGRLVVWWVKRKEEKDLQLILKVLREVRQRHQRQPQF